MFKKTIQMTKKLSIPQIESLKLFYNSILGFIPGAHIIEGLAEFKGNIQQERLQKFSEFLRDGFEKITEKKMDPENLKSEDFLDTFEIIMRKVVQTKSEEKLNRYKNVLIRKMFEKDDSEMFAKYLSLLDEVNDTQILILTSFTSKSPFRLKDIVGYLENPNDRLNHLVNVIEMADIKLFNGSFISWSELKFYLHDLKSKGILDTFDNQEIQHHASTNLTYSSKSNEIFNLSIIGEGFLDFIKEYGE